MGWLYMHFDDAVDDMCCITVAMAQSHLHIDFRSMNCEVSRKYSQP